MEQYTKARGMKVQGLDEGSEIKVGGIAFLVRSLSACGPNQARYGWTHNVYLQKPRGSKWFAMPYNADSGMCGTITG